MSWGFDLSVPSVENVCSNRWQVRYLFIVWVSTSPRKGTMRFSRFRGLPIVWMRRLARGQGSFPRGFLSVCQHFLGIVTRDNVRNKLLLRWLEIFGPVALAGIHQWCIVLIKHAARRTRPFLIKTGSLPNLRLRQTSLNWDFHLSSNSYQAS